LSIEHLPPVLQLGAAATLFAPEKPEQVPRSQIHPAKGDTLPLADESCRARGSSPIDQAFPSKSKEIGPEPARPRPKACRFENEFGLDHTDNSEDSLEKEDAAD